MPETGIEKKPVEPEREERVAKQQASYPTTEVVRSGCTSTGDSAVLFLQAKEELPFQKLVFDPSFLPALCHRLAMPQIAMTSLLSLRRKQRVFAEFR
jgi:hypothetical protein